MSRISDTRQRTREAAARLTASGRHPHELTVDLIYAEIKQGSRSTINDELKAWKDDQAKNDALAGAMPPPVADALRTTWRIALEQADIAFQLRREETEALLALSTTQLATLESQQLNAAATIERLQNDSDQARTLATTLTNALADERAQKEAATARTTVLEHQLATDKTDAASREAALDTQYRQELAQLRDAAAAQEIAFHQEITSATQRLEAVQKHVMLQLDEARIHSKRTEAELFALAQKNDLLAADKANLHQQLAALTQTADRAHKDLAAAQAEINRLAADRETLIQQAATAQGQLAAATKHQISLEQRASAAEKRLDQALKTARTRRAP